MKGNTLYNVSDPVNPQDVATKEYADKVGGGSPFVKGKGNYQATHAINMGFKKLLNLSTPSEPFEAATKDYVDNNVKKYVDDRPHIDMVHASYSGKLRKDKYQFTFGGTEIRRPGLNVLLSKDDTASGLDSGFLVPQSGRIKKIQTKISFGGMNFKGFKFLITGTSFFTFIAIKDTGEASNLLRMNVSIMII